jgi:predicted GTPase
MGYGVEMVKDLETTINNAEVDMVLSATPIDLTRIIQVNKPMQRVRYELQEIGKPSLDDLLREKFGKK